jgi:hypothetical protein
MRNDSIEEYETLINQEQYVVGLRNTRNFIKKCSNMLMKKVINGNSVIKLTNWYEDVTPNLGHPFKYVNEIRIDGVNSHVRADIFVGLEYYEDCLDSEFYNITETIDSDYEDISGYIKIRAKKIPRRDINFSYWIIDNSELINDNLTPEELTEVDTGEETVNGEGE